MLEKTKNTGRKRLSVVIPARNEEGNMARVYEELSVVRRQLAHYDFEFLLIDNASEDRTGEMCQEICRRDPEWKYVRFTRNFGSEASIAAGLQMSQGDASIVLFSDLQDPPDKIPELVEKWEQGNDIVFGVYEGNKHASFWKRWLVARYYALLAMMADSPMMPFAGDFRIYDKRVVKVLNHLRERNRYMRGLAQWVGFRSTHIRYERRSRRAGKSKAPFFYLFGFAFSVIVNFSDKPLRLFIVLGILVSMLSSLMGLLVVVNYFFNPVVPGLSTTHVLLMFNMAFISLGFGVLGEYISKIYIESKRRPLYIVDRAVGLSLDDAGVEGV
jgi:glycosyltransferase involved in cell wall biosynthesis